MTILNLYASSLTSGAVSDSSNALGSTAGTWTTDVDNVNWTARFAMDNPTAGLAPNGTQTVTLRVRKDSGDNPVINRITLFEGSTNRGNLGAGSWSVASTTGEDIAVTFDPTTVGIPNSGWNNVEIEIQVTGTGGSPANRATVQLDYIHWSGDFTVPSLSGTGSGTFDFSATTVSGAYPIYGPWSASDTETTPLGAVIIDGARSVTASPSGSARLILPGSGTRPTTATPSGAAFVVRTLSGTRPTTASHSGVAAVTRPASGSTSGTASISGAAAVIRPATGTTTATANITGSAPGTISVDGAFAVTAAPAGSGLSTAFASGTRSATATLSGTGVVIKPVSGTTAVTAAPAGTANATLSTMTGSRSVTASLAGEGEILILTQPSGTWILKHSVGVF